MDLIQIIHELRRERERILTMIEALERGGSGQTKTKGKRRGRKPMNGAERQEVSRRMKLYWEKRKQDQSAIVEANSPTVGD
jgi:hypothetical protein